MKQIIIILGIIFLLVNIAIGLILEYIAVFNLLMSCGVIIFTSIILLIVEFMTMKDGFKIPLFLLNSICGIAEYVVALVSRPDISNNWFYIVLILLITIQLFFLVVTNFTSKKIN